MGTVKLSPKKYRIHCSLVLGGTSRASGTVRVRGVGVQHPVTAVMLLPLLLCFTTNTTEIKWKTKVTTCWGTTAFYWAWYKFHENWNNRCPQLNPIMRTRGWNSIFIPSTYFFAVAKFRRNVSSKNPLRISTRKIPISGSQAPISGSEKCISSSEKNVLGSKICTKAGEIQNPWPSRNEDMSVAMIIIPGLCPVFFTILMLSFWTYLKHVRVDVADCQQRDIVFFRILVWRVQLMLTPGRENVGSKIVRNSEIKMLVVCNKKELSCYIAISSTSIVNANYCIR